MNKRLFSICTPCPEGFTFCPEFQAREFRRSPFALYAPSLENAREFLGDHLKRLAGLILVPGDHLFSEDLAPLVSLVVVSPAMLPYLADFAVNQLAQLNRRVMSDDHHSFLAMEVERLELDSKRSSEEFSSFRDSLLHEIDERRAAERQLAESEAKFRMLFEHSADPSLLIIHNAFVDCNQATVEILRAAGKEEVLNSHPSSISPEYQPDGRLSAEKADEMIATAVRNGSHRFEWTHRRLDGTDFPVEVSLTLIQEAGRPIIFTVWRDISERRAREELMKISEGKFRTIVESSPLAMYFYRLDASGDLILTGANPSADRIIGISHTELINKRIEDAFPNLTDTDVPEMYRKIARGAIGPQSFEIAYNDGRIGGNYQVQVYQTEPDCIAVDFMDITDRKRAEDERLKLEQQLLHAQKLESLGVLAGGIAHDFNNILMAIMGNADLALMRINKESPAVENLHRIEKAAAQAADLAKQMLAYSGKGRFVIENININNLLEEMLHMLEVSISKKAVLRLNLTEYLPSVEADATQMRQIVMNLVINASEAIGDKSGVIAITTGCMDCDRSYLKDVWLDENITAGLYVYLEIADTGCGMTKETLSKLFDPFFTTKFTGRGLGMAAVLGIVRGHKGAIKVYSELGKGTSFKILLPASNRPAELFDTSNSTTHWQGNGTVLLVDDEETVRGIGSEMLKELGFDTITANDGREAVEIFRNTPDIAFVILDLTMPHMDGEQCFRELRQLKPDIKVIMSSGYNEQEVTQKFVGKGLAGFIQKPYRMTTLEEKIRKLSS
jgi:PAS domain S-box-containing protein